MNPPSLEVLEFASEEGHSDRTPTDSDSPQRIALGLGLLLAIVVLCDVVIYRGEGFAGYAALFAALPVGMGIQSIRSIDRRSTLLLAMIAALVIELVWCGGWFSVTAGFVMLPVLMLTMTGRLPYVFDCINAAVQLIPGGFLAFTRYFPSQVQVRATPRLEKVAAIVIPVIAMSLFAVVFALANPDLISWLSDTLTESVRRLRKWLLDYGPGPAEVVFWFTTAWLSAGMLRMLRTTPPAQQHREDAAAATETSASPLYEMHRNSLIGLVALFAAYLGFEFVTLWGRVFPRGFHYSGYAHEGAAWLTLALAMATAGLSLVFTPRTLNDPRVSALRRLGNLWAIENLLLALAVYHRLHIYIGFNGMTRMRVVGLLGITAVVAGLLVVLWKIRRRYSFFWLVQRDLWVLALAMYAYCILPVDWLATKYNVHRIMAGDSAPSVQISVHPLSAEGLLELQPLLACNDTIVREGVRSMLALELRRLDTRNAESAAPGWTAYQLSEQKLHRELQGLGDELSTDADPDARKSARDAFDAYAYQWY